MEFPPLRTDLLTPRCELPAKQAQIPGREIHEGSNSHRRIYHRKAGMMASRGNLLKDYALLDPAEPEGAPSLLTVSTALTSAL